MRRILERIGVPFISQEPIKTRFREWPFKVDYLVARRLVIEVKGKYWHSKQRRRTKDEVKKACLEGEKYAYLEFWDYEIKKEPVRVESEIRGALIRLGIEMPVREVPESHEEGRKQHRHSISLSLARPQRQRQSI